jgi:hypothetical protein
LNCTSSSSQKHTGQITNVPGGFSCSVMKPHHGHAYRDVLIAHPPPAGSSRLSRPSVGKAFVSFRWLYRRQTRSSSCCIEGRRRSHVHIPRCPLQYLDPASPGPVSRRRSS